MIKDIFRLGIILFLISAIATGILAWVNGATQPIITERKAKEAIETRQKLMPDAKTFEEKKALEDTAFVYFVAKDDKGDVLGYTFVAENKGYSSIVKTMVALDKEFKVITLQVIDQNETPGLGTWCQDPGFPDRFKGQSLDGLKVDKDGGNIKSITGATITTRAITNSVHDAIQILQADIATGQPQEVDKPVEIAVKPNKTVKLSQELMPKAKTFEEKTAANSSLVYYVAKDDSGNLLGYSFVARKQAYSSVIRTMVCLDKDLKIVNMRVLNQNETPGLGARCAEPSFIDRFKSKGLKQLKVEQDGGKIECISGATITTRAICNSIRDNIQIVEKDIAINSIVGGQK